MQSLTWISAFEFADIARISERKGRLALQRAHSGKTWRGHTLSVIAQRGRGGASGISYLVRIDSLPPELHIRAEAVFGTATDEDDNSAPLALPAPATGTALAVQNQTPISRPVTANTTVATREWAWKREIIHPAMNLSKGSPERAAMIAELASKSYLMPNGRRKTFGETTLRNWVREYEKRGVAGLCRKGRSDRGKPRVMASQTWDQAMSEAGISPLGQKRIIVKLRRYVRSVWAQFGGGKGKGAPKNGGGWRNCCRYATKELIKLTRAAGIDLPDAQLLALCQVPRTFVELHRNYALLHMKNNDAKRFADTAKPRTRRTREGMMPMELVVGDVHHVDRYLRREDGSTYTPKMIAWSDIANNRIFWDLVFPEKGKSVCQKDINESYIRMTQHPEWGMPGALYIDNGSEYFSMEFIDDAMKLAALAQHKDFHVGLVGDAPEVSAAVKLAAGARSKAIVKAQPYNAPAKPIEGLFSVLESGPFAMVPGWIGGKRMDSKTKNVGKAPPVFDGTMEEFRDVFSTFIAFYETSPQNGSLKGLSPREHFAAAVHSGWKRTDAEEMAIRFAFSKREAREVKQGGEFSLHGNYYRASELATQLPGTKIIICIPKVGDETKIVVLDEDEKYLCIAGLSPLYGFLDPAGAKDRGQRIGAQSKAIRAMAHDVDKLDPMEEMREAIALHPPAPIPESGSTIRLSDEFEAAATATKQFPATQAQALDTQTQARLARRATLAKLAAAG